MHLGVLSFGPWPFLFQIFSHQVQGITVSIPSPPPYMVTDTSSLLLSLHQPPQGPRCLLTTGTRIVWGDC